MSTLNLHEGDCLAILPSLDADSFDAVVTDPPYHLASIVKRFGSQTATEAGPGTDGLFQRSSKGFMGKEWDGGDIAFRVETWAEILRVAKPGAHLVAFNHSRTWHHMATAIEAAGWEIRDSLMWLYGSGFPKSHDVARGVDKAVGIPKGWINCDAGPFSDEGKAWAGWGTALKPAFEPIVLARKPITAGSIAKQHLATGTGGLNIEAARIGGGEKRIIDGSGDRAESQSIGAFKGSKPRETTEGRWPANVVHDGSVEVVSRFPAEREGLSAARFFYSAKAGAKDRAGSEHPTVKPLALMQWLVRLTTPRGGRILDPFGGSGSTAWAAAVEGCACDLIERDPEYAAHIRGRMADFDPAKISQPTETPADETQGDLFNGGAL